MKDLVAMMERAKANDNEPVLCCRQETCFPVMHLWLTSRRVETVGVQRNISKKLRNVSICLPDGN